MGFSTAVEPQINRPYSGFLVTVIPNLILGAMQIIMSKLEIDS